MGFRELQCWVNNSNILFDNANDLISHYALWTDKDTSLDGLTSKMYDNTFIIPYDAIDTANSSDIALIIKNIPFTAINTIQSLVLYSRTAGKQHNEGVAIELYNSTDLTEILASTNIITLKRSIYRFDFPSIDTYTGGFATADSITQIISEGDIIIEDANLIPLIVEITGDVVASGSITASSAVVDTITSSKFRVANIITNATNLFPFPDEVQNINITIATGIICGGGTLFFHISMSAFNSVAQDESVLTFRLKNSSSTTVATIVMKHKFNNQNNIRSISIPQSFTGVVAGTHTLDMERNNVNFRLTHECFMSIVLTEFPL
jgi:hypothetical protein